MSHSLRTNGRFLVVLVSSLALVPGCEKSATKPNLPPAQTDFYVNAAAGLDTNDGTSAMPFKTITHAIAVADTDAWIHVESGTYDAVNGEVFPLVLKAGQTLIGDTLNKGNGSNTRVNVLGHGAIPGANPGWIDQYSTLIGARRATICGLRIGSTNEGQHFAIDVHDAAVTISNNTFADATYGGIYLTGPGASLVRANTFHTASYGVYMHGTASVVVQNNDFIEPALPIDIGELPGGNTVLRNNWIAGSGQVGIQVQAGTPLIDANAFSKPGGYPTYGAILCMNSNAMPKVRNNQVQFCALGVRIMDGAPDLGTAADPGLNFFYVNGVTVKHEGGAAVTAIGNIWPHSPPTSGVDIVVSGTGSVRWGAGAGEIVP